MRNICKHILVYQQRHITVLVFRNTVLWIYSGKVKKAKKFLWNFLQKQTKYTCTWLYKQAESPNDLCLFLFAEKSIFNFVNKNLKVNNLHKTWDKIHYFCSCILIAKCIIVFIICSFMIHWQWHLIVQEREYI